MKKKKVLLACGGSGGHVLPAEQLYTLLQDKADVLMAGHGLAKNPFVNKALSFVDIPAAPLGKIAFFTKGFQGFFKAIKTLVTFSPDVVVGFGSYHTFPLLLAAFCLRKKLILFEANRSLGKVNRLFAKAAVTVATQFVHTRKGTTLVDPLPWIVRPKPTRKEAFLYFNLDPKKPTLLIFGGSQGAKFLNEQMPKALAGFDNIQVLHFTGKGTVSYGCPSCVKEFETRMDLAYTAADLVICRSGAGTVAELLQHQKRALLIPFPHATDGHQIENGRFFAEEMNGGTVVEQSLATPEKIAHEILSLLSEKNEMKAWACVPRLFFPDLILQEAK
jgi:UDP-N-acetylglucosamine--N-acetylmuramyl-(pentapeptide) pyrophosphoryl-undecaprenol N-acetylglucosamine transferase